MKQYNEFNKETLTKLRKQLETDLAKYKAFGLDFKVDRIKYSSTTATITIESKLKGSKSKEVQALEFYSDFKEGDIIKIDQLGEVKLVGFKSKNRKYPFIVEAINTGKRYKLSQTHIDNRVGIV